MEQNTREFVEQKVTEMMNAFSCSAEAKTAGQRWLDALGTEREAEETEKLYAELEADVLSVDAVIAFAGSEAGVQVFGEEKAKELEEHGHELKAAGATYCDCPACAAGAAILQNR
ncbi:hypothetical protein M2145_001144 [Lachnospiraceae bacterium PF1-21]|uniref:molecular chaperone Hsp90 n=1 Tax=Ohessyouella blattaphilus TaxID=2949333 RepID=UPI003E1F793D